MPMPKKRSDEKAGRPNGPAQPVDKFEVEGEIQAPEPAEYWHEIAKFAYEGYLKSPVMDFATETDIAFAWATCDTIHKALTGKPSAMMIQAAESMMRNALFTEQARRSARIEITRKTPEPDSVVQNNVAEFRKRREQAG